MLWTCSNCGRQDNEGAQCRGCLAKKPAEKRIPMWSVRCRFCGKDCGEKVIEQGTIFGAMRRTVDYCYHCNSFQV